MFLESLTASYDDQLMRSAGAPRCRRVHQVHFAPSNDIERSQFRNGEASCQARSSCCQVCLIAALRAATCTEMASLTVSHRPVASLSFEASSSLLLELELQHPDARQHLEAMESKAQMNRHAAGHAFSPCWSARHTPGTRRHGTSSGPSRAAIVQMSSCRGAAQCQVVNMPQGLEILMPRRRSQVAVCSAQLPYRTYGWCVSARICILTYTRSIRIGHLSSHLPSTIYHLH